MDGNVIVNEWVKGKWEAKIVKEEDMKEAEEEE